MGNKELHPGPNGSVWRITVISIVLTKLDRGCGLAYPYDWIGFERAKKETIERGPLSILFYAWNKEITLAAKCFIPESTNVIRYLPRDL
jgi:hypothetical protein